MSFDAEELQRYSRHFSLPAVGLDGQQKLKKARVLCIGAGGLGSPVLFYLAAAGVGTIGIVDNDVVDLSNLQRQIIYSTQDIGKNKARVAREKIVALNSTIQVFCYAEKLTAQNAFMMMEPYDIIVDCTDNFPSRYLINDVCFHLKKPNVAASIFQFAGQCSLFSAWEGPCYRCLYPTPPPSHAMPSCDEGGVLGVLPGLLGSIQALEVIKWILNLGQSLRGRLLTVDARQLQFHEFQLFRSPDCPLCAYQQPFATLSHDGENSCMTMKLVEEITVQELAQLREGKKDFLLIDVREPDEYEAYNLEGKLIPLGKLPERLKELDAEQLIIVHCQGGSRSRRAVEFLLQSGFSNVKNLKGGARAWREEIEHEVQKY